MAQSTDHASVLLSDERRGGDAFGPVDRMLAALSVNFPALHVQAKPVTDPMAFQNGARIAEETTVLLPEIQAELIKKSKEVLKRDVKISWRESNDWKTFRGRGLRGRRRRGQKEVFVLGGEFFGSEDLRRRRRLRNFSVSESFERIRQSKRSQSMPMQSVSRMPAAASNFKVAMARVMAIMAWRVTPQGKWGGPPTGTAPRRRNEPSVRSGPWCRRWPPGARRAICAGRRWPCPDWLVFVCDHRGTWRWLT